MSTASLREFLLEIARKFETGEIKLSKHAYARNNKNEMVEIDDPSANCFCMLGAVLKFIPKETQLFAICELKDAVLKQNNCILLAEFNDSPTTDVAKVVKAFKDAAELCRV